MRTPSLHNEWFSLLHNIYSSVLNVPLTAGLLQSVRSSSHRRRLAVEADKQKLSSEATSKKRKAALELQLSAI